MRALSLINLWWGVFRCSVMKERGTYTYKSSKNVRKPKIPPHALNNEYIPVKILEYPPDSSYILR